jgi:uncharacterized lipoprotein YbaY
MKKHAHFDSLVGLTLIAAFAVSLAACKKQEPPAPVPQPKAATETEVTQADSGTTTTYAPPAAEPQQPPATAPAQ